MNIDLIKFLLIFMIVFLIGLWGIFLNRKNILIIILSIELLLLGINLKLITFSIYLNDIVGELFTLFILSVAAAESSIGVALLVSYYRIRGSILIEFVNLMKG